MDSPLSKLKADIEHYKRLVAANELEGKLTDGFNYDNYEIAKLVDYGYTYPESRLFVYKQMMSRMLLQLKGKMQGDINRFYECSIYRLEKLEIDDLIM